MLEQHRRGGRLAIGVEAHHGSAAVFPPAVGGAHFDSHAGQASGQHALFVGSALAVEGGGAGHRHHAHRNFELRSQQLLRLERQLHFRPRGHDDGLRFFLHAHIRRFAQHIRAFADVGQIGLGRIGQVLAAEQQRGGLALVLQRHGPSNGGFGGVTGAPHVEVGNQAQAGGMLHRLVGGAVFTQANAVVREHVNDALLHERSHANGVAAVVAKREEGATVGDVAAVQRHAVHDGGHAELAYTVVDVAALLALVVGLHLAKRAKAQVGRVRGVGEVGAREVGRAAQHFGQGCGKEFERDLAGLTAGHGFGLGVCGHGSVHRNLVEVGR